VWTISKAMLKASKSSRFLPGAAVESSAESCSAGEPFAPSKSKSTPEAYLFGDKTKDTLNRSRSGLTYAPLTADRGEALLTSFRAGFPVKTYQAPEEGPGLPDPDLDYGGKWRELSAKFDRDSCSWKTHRCLFAEVLTSSSLTLPQWGMTRDGVLWGRTTPALRTLENGSGFWPTPCAQGLYNQGHMIQLRKKVDNGQISFLEAMIMTSGTICTNKNLPPWRTKQHKEHFKKHGKHYSGGKFGNLDPTFYEYLMGWPIDWTGSKQLETDRFQLWLNLHGKP